MFYARFARLAKTANRFAHADRESCDGFQASHARRGEHGIILSPGLGQQKLGIAENAGQRIGPFVAKPFAEVLRLGGLFDAVRSAEFRNEPSCRMQMLLETG